MARYTRLAHRRRQELVERIEEGTPVATVARQMSVSWDTAYKSWRRFQADPEGTRPSRPGRVWLLPAVNSSAWLCSRLPTEAVEEIYAGGPDQIISVSFAVPVDAERVGDPPADLRAAGAPLEHLGRLVDLAHRRHQRRLRTGVTRRRAGDPRRVLPGMRGDDRVDLGHPRHARHRLERCRRRRGRRARAPVVPHRRRPLTRDVLRRPALPAASGVGVDMEGDR